MSVFICLIISSLVPLPVPHPSPSFFLELMEFGDVISTIQIGKMSGLLNRYFFAVSFSPVYTSTPTTDYWQHFNSFLSLHIQTYIHTNIRYKTVT